MTFKTLYGREKRVSNSYKFKIDWNGKSRSKFQESVKKFIYIHWRYDLVFEEFRIPGSKLSIDFYNHTKRIAIEVQGAQHIQYVKHFHRTKANFLNQIKRDFKKIEFCELNNIKLIEIYPEDQLSEDFFEKLLG